MLYELDLFLRNNISGKFVGWNFTYVARNAFWLDFMIEINPAIQLKHSDKFIKSYISE